MQLFHKLKVGQTETLEGPYGCFTFDDAQPVQIWIRAGIGITPFIAIMEYRAVNGIENEPIVHFFHSTKEVDEGELAKLDLDAKAANVQLHVLIDARDGYFTGDKIRQAVPDWKDASIWFCGPAMFGGLLRADFEKQGVPVHHRSHQELFNRRKVSQSVRFKATAHKENTC